MKKNNTFELGDIFYNRKEAQRPDIVIGGIVDNKNCPINYYNCLTDNEKAEIKEKFEKSVILWKEFVKDINNTPTNVDGFKTVLGGESFIFFGFKTLHFEYETEKFRVILKPEFCKCPQHQWSDVFLKAGSVYRILYYGLSLFSKGEYWSEDYLQGKSLTLARRREKSLYNYEGGIYAKKPGVFGFSVPIADCTNPPKAFVETVDKFDFKLLEHIRPETHKNKYGCINEELSWEGLSVQYKANDYYTWNDLVEITGFQDKFHSYRAECTNINSGFRYFKAPVSSSDLCYVRLANNDKAVTAIETEIEKIG